MSYEIQTFDLKHIPLVIDVVLPLWSPPYEDVDFRRFYVEHIIRSNYFDNSFNFQLMENNCFSSMAFFARRDDFCNVEEWFSVESKKFSQKLVASAQRGKKYIELMDEKTRALMNKDDIQLTLYVSRKRGSGSRLLDEVSKRLFNQGYKNLYLWTDCECNWQWYINHGYDLISKEAYEPFSKDEDYMTYIFRKKLY